MIDYMHVQLSIWGKWCMSKARRDVGFPSVSPMFRDMASGGGYGSRIPSGVTMYSVQNMMDMDEAVAMLPIKERALCAEFYIVGGKSMEIAARIGVTKKRLYEMLDVMHSRLLGLLNDVVASQ